LTKNYSFAILIIEYTGKSTSLGSVP